MKPLFVFYFAICWLGVLAGSARAVDYYVNNLGGNDRFDGRAEGAAGGRSGPWRTLERAMLVVGPGDRLHLAKTAQPYRESLQLGAKQSGQPGMPLTIVGHGATLDGTHSIPGEAWENFHGDVYRFRPAGLGYQSLFRDGRPLRQFPVDRLAGNIPPLRPLEWCLKDSYIYLCTEKNKHPMDYVLSHSFQKTGITLYGVQYVIVSDLYVQGFRYDGIAAPDRARDIRLMQLTLQGNGRSGLSVSGASEVTLDSALVRDNGQAQVRVEAPGRLSVDHCELSDASAPRYEILGGAKLLVDNVPVKVSVPVKVGR
jgi:hypothetical protein